MTSAGGAGAGGAWVTLRVNSHESATVIAALFDAGALGVHEDGDWVVTQVPDQHRANALLCAVLAADPEARVETAPLVMVDWAEEWKRSVCAQTAGEFTIIPPWLAEGRDLSRTIIIEPAMAFGTGEHATTRGVLRLLPGVIRDGDRVADLGAGSAVLAIAAARLGASRAIAVEIDPDAMGNAEANVARNDVGDRVALIRGDAAVLLPLIAPVRVITANIVSSVLLELLPAMARALAPDGEAILSGILVSERESVLRALDDSGWLVRAEDQEDGWWSATIARRWPRS